MLLELYSMAGKTPEFLKEKDCEATAEELTVFLKNRSNGELSDDELDNVAGGCNEELCTQSRFPSFRWGRV